MCSDIKVSTARLSITWDARSIIARILVSAICGSECEQGVLYI